MFLSSPGQAVKRCAASLVASSAFLLALVGQASADTTTMTPGASTAPAAATPATSPAAMSGSTPTGATGDDNMAQASYFPSNRANDPCTNINALTSRPLVTTSTCVVPQGHALIEAGYMNEKNPDTGDITTVYPLATLRIGTNIKNLEISVTGPSESRTKTVSGAHPHNIGDSAVGAKYFLGNSKKFAHSVSVGLTLPTGDQNGSRNASSYNASYNAQYDFTHVFAARVSENFTSNAYRGTSTLADPNPPTLRYGSFVSSLALLADIPKAVNLFAEESAYSHNYGNGSSQTEFIGGLSKPIGQRLQIDAEYSASNEKNAGGPNQKAHGIGAGLAFYL